MDDPTSDPGELEPSVDARALGERLRELVDADAAAAEVDEDKLDDKDEHADEDEQHRRIGELQAELAILLGHSPDDQVMPCPTCRMGIVQAGLRHDQTAGRCSACDGYGVVMTGSLVEGNAIRPCGRCAGMGFEATAPPPPDPSSYRVRELEQQAPLTPGGEVRVPPPPPMPTGRAA